MPSYNYTKALDWLTNQVEFVTTLLFLQLLFEFIFITQIMTADLCRIILLSQTVLISFVMGCENFVTLTVKENVPYPSPYLLDVSRHLHSAHITTTDDKESIYLTDLSGSKPFILTNGKLSVNGVLDREQICNNIKPDQRLSIQRCCLASCCMYIGVTTGQGKTMYIRVNIEDENDNEPKFPQHALKIQLHENVGLGFNIAIPKAIDEDSSKFGIEKYGLVQDKKTCGDCFQLKYETRDGGIALITKAKIDREEYSEFRLQVLSIDKGVPAKTGTLNVMIEVIDINDNNPQFEETSLIISVEENGRSGREIRLIKVTDADTGINSQISYHIEDYAAISQKYFRLLSARSGVSLLLQSTLDYELINEFNFKIIARDHGTPSLSSSVDIHVLVINVNDESPEIIFYQRGLALDPNSVMLQLPENGQKQQSIILVHVTDKDSKLADISCEVLYPKETFYLQENPHTNIIEKKKIFDLQNAVTFDREVTSQYRISISCSDSNTLIKLTHSVEIQLRIIDENDNPPVFSSSFYFGKIMETNSLDTPIILMENIKVTDYDIDVNSRLDFLLADIGNSTDARQFATATHTPLIKNSAPIDFEEKKQFVFLLIAKDNGSPVLSSSATITVNVLDANDNRPEISKKFYSFSVLEEQPIGSEIGRIEATDADTDPGNIDFIYEIVHHDGVQSNTRPNKLFVIENNTGSIKTTVVLDHERDQHVTFQVRVKNSNDDVMARDRMDVYGSAVTINVKIEDINDNYPVLVFKNYESGSHNDPVKRPMITITSDTHSSSNPCTMFPYTFTDADEGINSEVRVSLKTNPHFKLEMGHSLICPTSANISPGSYTIYVVGEDRNGGNGSKHSEHSVNVIVKSHTANKQQTHRNIPRHDTSEEKLYDSKTLVIFIVLIASIIIFCFILMIVVIKTKLCNRRNTTPSSKSRENTADKQNNAIIEKNYNVLIPGGSCENKQRLYSNYLSGTINNNRNLFNSDIANNISYPQSGSPSIDIINRQYPSHPQSGEFRVHSDQCDTMNSDTKYEQLHRTMLIQSDQLSSNVDITKYHHQYNYLLAAIDGNSPVCKPKHNMVAVGPPYQKSINDVYLQTSFV